MNDVLTGPWGLFTATLRELVEIGEMAGVSVALTILINWRTPFSAGED